MVSQLKGYDMATHRRLAHLAHNDESEGESMDSASPDLFTQTYERLEKVDELLKKGVLDEAQHQKFRMRLLSVMEDAIGKSEYDSPKASAPQFSRMEPTASTAPPYGLLHAQLVEQLAKASQNSGDDDKQLVSRAIQEMAATQVLFPADMALLNELAEIVFRPFAIPAEDTTADAGIRQVLERWIDILQVFRRIRESQTSPVTQAIGAVTDEAVNRASKECVKPEVKKSSEVGGLWNRLVLPDVKGAFWGGAQAAGIATFWGGAQAAGTALHLGPNFLSVLPYFAASGVIIGAATESGITLGTYWKTKAQ